MAKRITLPVSDAIELMKEDMRLTNRELGELLGASHTQIGAWIARKSLPQRRKRDKIAEVALANDIAIDWSSR